MFIEQIGRAFNADTATVVRWICQAALTDETIAHQVAESLISTDVDFRICEILSIVDAGLGARQIDVTDTSFREGVAP